ncbi:MAG TPA: hypothetical protein VD770_02185, partial [Coxiellaceae bacterium]|nr:hypothetical protein [Coxiellaceae bacterium]
MSRSTPTAASLGRDFKIVANELSAGLSIERVRTLAEEFAGAIKHNYQMEIVDKGVESKRIKDLIKSAEALALELSATNDSTTVQDRIDQIKAMP